jgi:type IV pilus assembly protein PilC
MTFSYRARTPNGECVRGTMRALDRSAALGALRERLLIPSHLEPSSTAFDFFRAIRTSRPAERLAFFRAYAALESAGVDFSTAFRLLIEQTRTTRMRDALASIRFDVERGGEKLWAAMSHRPDEFTDLEVALVAAGEEAGNREEIFDRLATLLERDEALRKAVSAALVYPAFVVLAAGAVCVYLFAVIVPQFARLFASFGVELSPVMAVLLELETIFMHPLTLLAAGAVALFAFWSLARALRDAKSALALDRLRMRVPIVGATIRKTTVARLCRVLATLLQAGVPHVRALEVAVPVCDSPLFARAVEMAAERLATGLSASLEEALECSGAFPPLVLGFVRVGASAGTMPQMLAKVAEYYESDVATILEALPAAIQTAITLLLGAVVAGIVYVVYVPLATLSTSIR